MRFVLDAAGAASPCLRRRARGSDARIGCSTAPGTGSAEVDADPAGISEPDVEVGLDDADLAVAALRLDEFEFDADLTIPVVCCATTDEFDIALQRVSGSCDACPSRIVAATDGRTIFIRHHLLWDARSCPSTVSEILAHEVARVVLHRRGRPAPLWIGEGFTLLAAGQPRRFDRHAGVAAHEDVDLYDITSATTDGSELIAPAMTPLVDLLGERSLAARVYRVGIYRDDAILGHRTMMRDDAGRPFSAMSPIRHPNAMRNSRDIIELDAENMNGADPMDPRKRTPTNRTAAEIEQTATMTRTRPSTTRANGMPIRL